MFFGLKSFQLTNRNKFNRRIYLEWNIQVAYLVGGCAAVLILWCVKTYSKWVANKSALPSEFLTQLLFGFLCEVVDTVEHFQITFQFPK